MDLSPFQFGLISNLMSLTVAGMGAATLFFFLSRSQVAPAYRPALLISGLVVAIACYHYFRIYQSFTGAYVLQDGLRRLAADGAPAHHRAGRRARVGEAPGPVAHGAAGRGGAADDRARLPG